MMRECMPKVSILLSVFNNEDTIKRSIKSVLSQTYSNFELIIINDASNDQTCYILEELSNTDCRICVYTNVNNLGLTCSLNKGLKFCNGDYIARIDADDIWHQDKLQKQMDFMLKNPEYALLGTAYEEVDSKGQYYRGSTVPFHQESEALKKAMIKYNPFFHSSVIIRRDVLTKFGGYDKSCFYAQDYNLWVRIAAEYEIANLSHILAYRGMSQDNISVKKEKQQRISALKSKLLALKMHNNIFNYRYLIADVVVIIMPKVIVNLVRLIKTKILVW